MHVESASASTTSVQTSPYEQDHRVQSVFSSILQAAGRSGYASAGAVEEGQPSVEDVQTAWHDWFDSQRSGGRYASSVRPEHLKQEYGDVLASAYAESGYVRPKEFLSSLTPDELRTVQDAHRLAKPIDVGSLTEEGALNLLLPGATQVDLDRDGLTQTGLAYGLKFPSSNTPATVVAAWEEATVGMELRDRMFYELQMMMPLLTANFVVDENGAYSHHFEPGDPGFRNPMADVGYSYVQATQDRLDHLEFVKSQISQQEYDRQTEFWEGLQELLKNNGTM